MMADRSGLQRKITVNQAAQNMYWLLASGRVIEKLPNGAYAIDDKEYYIESPQGIDEKALKIVRKNDDLYELLLPLAAQKNNSPFSYSIIW